MSFIDIRDPKKRDQIVADYMATIRRVQQRNEDDKSAGLAKQAELENTFNPIVKATEKSTEIITKQLEPLQDELKTMTEKITARPLIARRKRTWDDRTGLTAISYYLNDYNKNELDKYYGIKEDEDGNFVLGTKQVFVDGNSNITIDNHTYQGTPGLWSLIMLASPNGYTNEDSNVYRELVAQTDLMNHPRGVNKTSRPKSTVKRRILESLLQKAGTGISFLPGDIKGLTSKLNLLLAEFRAGNKSTRNEIVSILDELLRRKRMSRKEYTEINSFIASSL